MPRGFFSDSQVRRDNPATLRNAKCGACGLAKGCLSPKMPVAGKGERGILIIAEAPSAAEDQQNEPLVGESGKLLRDELRRMDVNLDRDCWKTNAVICRPPANRTPDDREIQACRPNVFRAIEDLEPSVIILLGNPAIQSVIGKLWVEKPGGVGKWAGQEIRCREPNAWIHVTYHPAYLQRNKQDDALWLWFRRHLRAAVDRAGSRPWVEPIPYRDRVEVELSPSKAATQLKEWKRTGGTIAFDYETTALKPEYPGARIYTCAVSHEGRQTLAYPWHGDAVDATMRLLASRGTQKVAANLKFEDRWTRHAGGIVRNWFWDTMIAAHVLDCREGLCGLKLQAFIELGCPEYDAAVGPYLSSKGHLNRIEDADLMDVLRYNAMDALLEYELALVQQSRLQRLRPGIMR